MFHKPWFWEHLKPCLVFWLQQGLLKQKKCNSLLHTQTNQYIWKSFSTKYLWSPPFFHFERSSGNRRKNIRLGILLIIIVKQRYKLIILISDKIQLNNPNVSNRRLK